jgi:hypothetical protein
LYHGTIRLNVMRPLPMDSAEVIVVRPLKPCSLTAGEYFEATSSDSAITIDGTRQNARNIIPAQNLDMMEFERNIRTPFV